MMNITLISNQNSVSSTKWWNVSLWTAQLALAVLFSMGGYMKALMPLDQLHVIMPWSADLPDALVRFIGISQLLAVLGLTLPAVTRIRPQLTALAGAGLALTMLLAAIFHLVRGEGSAIGINLLLGTVAAFIAWGRTRRAPIAPRS